MRNLAKPERPPREQVFVIVCAVDGERYTSDCSRALGTLKKAGYVARPMSHETLKLLSEDPFAIPQFREIGEPFDPPPAA